MEGGKEMLAMLEHSHNAEQIKTGKKRATQQCAERCIPSLKAHRRGRRGLRLLLLPCLAGYCQLVVISTLRNLWALLPPCLSLILDFIF